MRRAAALAVIVAALLMSACSGNNSELSGVATAGVEPSTTTEGVASSSPFPESSPAKKSSEPFNPFDTTPASATGGREVIQNPTTAEIMAPGPLPEMTLGRPDAPVTVIQYASLTCPHCRAFHKTTWPEFERTYIKTGKVRFIMREFPIGKQSGNATIALRCAPPAKYFDLYGKFMDQQANWVSQEVRLEPIFAVAKQVGMTQTQFDSCLKNQAMIDGLKWVKDRGRTLGVIGTPMFFIGGKLVKKTLTMSEMRELIDPLLATPQAAVAN